MWPLAALGAGSQLFGSLFGHGGHGDRIDPAQLAALFGPGALASDTNQLYSLMANSPGARAALGSINLQGQNLSQDLAAGFARRGLTSSGIGTVAQGLGGAASGFGQAQYQGGLYNTAMDSAQSNLLARLQAYMQNKNANIGNPSMLERLAGGAFGAAGPALAQYFGSKNRPGGGGGFGGWNAGMGGSGTPPWQGSGIWG